MELIFATNNRHKVEEIRSLLPSGITLQTMAEAGIDIDIPEPHDTLEANAKEKAETIRRISGKACFSEDTGLEVFQLNNEPGVRSARYAGDKASAEDNMNKLLAALKGNTPTPARFRTVICLITEKGEWFFEGICEGQIISERRGNTGFGYDPVFIPTGSDRTFAQMSMAEKSVFSHRGKAVAGLVTFLNNLQANTQY